MAAAIKSAAATIVTFNLEDFPSGELGKYGIEAQHPDDFIVHQIGLSPPKVCLAAKRQRASLKNPPKTVEEYLTTLEQQRLPQAVTMLKEFSNLL